MHVWKCITAETRFAFLHIPKTAGVTVLTFFRDVLGTSAVLQHGHEGWHINQLGPELAPHVRLIGGHFHLEQVPPGLRDRFHYISIVRDPVVRIVSHHKFIINLQFPDVVHAMLPHREINADIAGSESYRQHVQNEQVRYLSPDGTVNSIIRMVEEGRLSIATIDEMDEFLPEIAQRAGLPFRKREPMNVSPFPMPELSPATREVLADLTRDDQRLFDFVLQR